jgi:hypothetical protein
MSRHAFIANVSLTSLATYKNKKILCATVSGPYDVSVGALLLELRLIKIE